MANLIPSFFRFSLIEFEISFPTQLREKKKTFWLFFKLSFSMLFWKDQVLPYVVSNKGRQYTATAAQPRQPAGNEGEGKFKINKKRWGCTLCGKKTKKFCSRVLSVL